MKEKTNDKINEIERYLEELADIVPSNFEEYKDNFEKEAACERYFEKIVESVIDLCFIIAKDKGFKMPEEDEAIFDVFYQEKIISRELSKRLKDAKGMRNFIIHQYGKIDNELVFEAVSEQIISDVNEFIKCILKGLR